jgi:hypothetical protein
MEVSVVWLGLAIIGITLLFLFTQAKGVYDAFSNYEPTSEGFIGTGGNQTDIRLISCPADYKQFVNNDGQILCCDGTPNSGKCSGRTLCSLSEGAGGIPTCSAWYTAYLDEKGRNKCPPSMPSYFESKDGKMKGCTSGKRKEDGSGPLNSSVKFCRMYTTQKEEEGKANSCANVLMLDNTNCFPGSSVKTDKSLTEVLGGLLPARIQCSFGDPSIKTAGSCETDKSMDRFMNGVYTLLGIRGSWKDGFMRWDPLDKINMCSITQKYKIDKTIGFNDLPSIGIDGKVTSPKPSDYEMYGNWVKTTTVQKISKLPDGSQNIFMIQDGIYTKAVREDNKSAKYFQGKIENFNLVNWNSYPDATGNYLVRRK